MTGDSRCPECDTRTEVARSGAPSLCLSCSEAEIGETYPELRDRVTKATHKGGNRKWRVTT